MDVYTRASGDFMRPRTGPILLSRVPVSRHHSLPAPLCLLSLLLHRCGSLGSALDRTFSLTELYPLWPSLDGALLPPCSFQSARQPRMMASLTPSVWVRSCCLDTIYPRQRLTSRSSLCFLERKAISCWGRIAADGLMLWLP